MNKLLGSIRMTTAIAGALLLFLAPNAFAGRGIGWPGSGGWGSGSAYQRMYDPKTTETIQGEVVSIEKVVPLKGMHNGIHLTVKTEKGTVAANLGPDWYVERQDTKISLKDTVEIKGSRVQIDGRSVIIAAEVKKGDEILTLRDSSGIPVWSGWRRR